MLHSAPSEQNYGPANPSPGQSEHGHGGFLSPPNTGDKRTQVAENANYFQDRSGQARKLPKESLPFGGGRSLCLAGPEP